MRRLIGPSVKNRRNKDKDPSLDSVEWRIVTSFDMLYFAWKRRIWGSLRVIKHDIDRIDSDLSDLIDDWRQAQ